MSRVISTESPGKLRNQYRRVIAEALRRLSMKPQLDAEACDIAALIVLSLQGIANTVDQTIDAWERRDYYMKAERFREQWRWVEPAADSLSAVIFEERWDDLPLTMAELMPHFSDITVKRMVHKPSLWEGAYERLLKGG